MRSFYMLPRNMLIVLLILFLPSLVLDKYLGKSFVDAVILIGFASILIFNIRNKTFSHSEESLIKFGVIIFCVALLGFFQQTQDLTRFGPALENYLKVLLPLAVIPLFHLIKLSGLKLISLSIILACLVAFSLSVYGTSLNLPRGGGSLHGSPIIFGDLSMLFGLVAFVFSLYFIQTKQYWFVVFLIVAGVLGIASSFLSASKGGWIALVTVPFVFMALFKTRSERFKFLLSVLILLLVTLILLVFTENQAKTRLIHAWNEIQNILVEGDFSGRSLGYRIQIWEVSLLAFLSNPLFGIGVGEFYAFKYNLILAGEASEGIVRFKHAHNEYLTILSGMGLLGFIVYALFFRWLWRFFMNALNSGNKENKVIGLAGLVTIVCYLDFSLTESFLSSHLGASAFYFLITLFVYLISSNRVGGE